MRDEISPKTSSAVCPGMIARPAKGETYKMTCKLTGEVRLWSFGERIVMMLLMTMMQAEDAMERSGMIYKSICHLCLPLFLTALNFVIVTMDTGWPGSEQVKCGKLHCSARVRDNYY